MIRRIQSSLAATFLFFHLNISERTRFIVPTEITNHNIICNNLYGSELKTMFYSYFNSQAGIRPAYGTSITYSGAQSTKYNPSYSTSIADATTNANAAARCTTILFIRRVFLPGTSCYTVRKFFSYHSIWDCIQFINRKETICVYK